MCHYPYTYNVLHLQTTNDVSGNPRRAYVVLMDDGTHGFFSEGYLGREALPSDYSPAVIFPVKVSPGELNKWRKGATFSR